MSVKAEKVGYASAALQYMYITLRRVMSYEICIYLAVVKINIDLNCYTSAAENWNKVLPLQTCQGPERKMRETSLSLPPIPSSPLSS
jgi:hypothetical protein